MTTTHTEPSFGARATFTSDDKTPYFAHALDSDETLGMDEKEEDFEEEGEYEDDDEFDEEFDDEEDEDWEDEFDEELDGDEEDDDD